MIIIKDLESNSDINSFDCENSSINNYLKDSAFYDQVLRLNRTKIIEHKEKVIAFVTLSLVEVVKSDEEDEFNYFGMDISYLGVEKEYQNKKIGKYLLDYVINETIEFSKLVGLRYVVLDALTERIKWYESNGFKVVDDFENTSDKTVRMELDLRDPEELEEIFTY